MNAHDRAASLAALDLDFPLSSTERRELDAHLENCPACRRLAAGLRADAASLRSIAGVAPAPRLRAAFAAAAARPERVTVLRRVDFWPSLRLAAVAALVAALTMGLVAVGLISGSHPSLLSGPASPLPSSRPAGATVAVVHRTVAICPGSTDLRLETDSVVLLCDGVLDRDRLDGSGVQTLTIEIAGIAPTSDSIWAVNSGALVRLNASSGAVTARIAGAAGDVVAADTTAAWVVRRASSTVIRVDAATNRIAATIPVGPDPQAILLALGRVWVSNRGNNTVSEIDPATNAVKATITVTYGPLGLVSAASAIWVVHEPASGEVSRIDPATAAANTIHVASPAESHVTPLIASDGKRAIWVVDTGTMTLVEVDATSGSIVNRLSVPGIAGPASEIDGLAIVNGSIWVSDATGALRELTAP